MAAAIIPLIASGVSALLPLIPGIVQGVENLFGAKTGQAKMDAAVAMAMEAAKALAAAGKIQGIPDLSSVASLVEVIVQQLKNSGQLPPPTGAAPSQPGGTFVSQVRTSGYNVINGATVIILERV
jgi:hypothetical protein